MNLIANVRRYSHSRLVTYTACEEVVVTVNYIILQKIFMLKAKLMYCL